MPARPAEITGCGAWQRPSRPRSRSAFQSPFWVFSKINVGLASNIIAIYERLPCRSLSLREPAFSVDSRWMEHGRTNREFSECHFCCGGERERSRKCLSAATQFVPRMICCCLFGLRGSQCHSELLFRFYDCKRKLFGQQQLCEREDHSHPLLSLHKVKKLRANL